MGPCCIVLLLVVVLIGLSAIVALVGPGIKDGANQGKASRPLVVFLLAPLSPEAVKQLKQRELELEPNEVLIYTMSDTLRCGAENGLGGQLPFHKPACRRLFGDLAEIPKKYTTVLGENFNQAWHSDAWGDVMKWISSDRMKNKAKVFLYPTELFKNPHVAELFKNILPNPSEYKTLDVEGKGAEWNAFTPLQKYWLLYCMSKNAQEPKREPIFDIGPVVDFALHNDGGHSLARHAQPVDWCVAEPPDPDKNGRVPMVYFDEPEGTVCANATFAVRGSNDRAVASPVAVSLPRDEDDFKAWLAHYGEAIKEGFAVEPGSLGGPPCADVPKDAIIIQDTLDADNPLSVVWLLKRYKFASTLLISVSQPTNFKTHKLQYNGGFNITKKQVMNDEGFCPYWKTHDAPSLDRCPPPLFSRVEDYNLRVGAAMAASRDGFPDGQELAAVRMRDVKFVFDQFADGARDVAWPELVGRFGVTVSQPAANKSDSALMVAHNIARWRAWLLTYLTSDDVEIIDGGYPEVSPLSHAIEPYTFYYFVAQSDATASLPIELVDFPAYTAWEEEADSENNTQHIKALNSHFSSIAK